MDIRTRYFVDELKVHSEVHKWMWIVLMGVSFVTATNRILDYGWLAQSAIDQATLLASYLIYICFIYRFFVGDRKIVEHFYSSLPTALGESGPDDFKTYLDTITRGLLVFDGISRIAQLLVFLPVASKIHNPVFLTLGLAFLLLLNGCVCLIGLLVTHSRSGALDDVSKRVLDVTLSGRKYRWYWAINNLVCFALIVAIVYLEFTGSIDHGIQFILAVLAINCVVDISTVNKLYLPNYRVMYRPLPVPQADPMLCWRGYQAAAADSAAEAPDKD